jgi:hypothetical protein
MNTKNVMAASAIFLGILGLICSFLPQEILTFFKTESTPFSILLAKIVGALFLGFGILNWMAKSSIIGGIYAKPLSQGNALHFFTGTMALLRSVFPENPMPILWLIFIPYLSFTILFGLITFGKFPLKNGQ